MTNNLASLGKVVVTPAAQNSMDEQGIQTTTLLQGHLQDNWNDLLLEDGEFTLSRLMSAQKIPTGELWVITEFDRQVTTISLPDEMFNAMPLGQ